MKEKCKVKEITYLGIDRPNSVEEIKVEITGLEHAISQAQELICRLNQALALVALENSEVSNADNSSKTA
jgi:hypothetical protein